MTMCSCTSEPCSCGIGRKSTNVPDDIKKKAEKLASVVTGKFYPNEIPFLNKYLNDIEAFGLECFEAGQASNIPSLIQIEKDKANAYRFGKNDGLREAYEAAEPILSRAVDRAHNIGDPFKRGDYIELINEIGDEIRQKAQSLEKEGEE